MANLVSSTVFCMRNVNKAEHRDNPVSKASVMPIVLGQLYNSVIAWDEAISAFNIANKPLATRLSSLAKEDAILTSAGKMAKVAGTFINPLICVASATDALTSKDKPAAITVNGSALLSMFAAEHIMKNHFTEQTISDLQSVKTAATKVSNFVAKHNNGKLAASMTEKTLTSVLPKMGYGGLFVVASIGGYTLGSKFGKLLVHSARGNSNNTLA